ncbi:MAG: hypothetical protein LBP75_08580 [Planctomycetota bacterium]|jgi:hypothetical protein|nr:hypothetical protein [Planctomycetota bacterium]
MKTLRYLLNWFDAWIAALSPEQRKFANGWLEKISVGGFAVGVFNGELIGALVAVWGVWAAWRFIR